MVVEIEEITLTDFIGIVLTILFFIGIMVVIFKLM